MGGGGGVEEVGEGGSEAPPFPQENPPLPLHVSTGLESRQTQGEGPGEGVQRYIHFLRGPRSGRRWPIPPSACRWPGGSGTDRRTSGSATPPNRRASPRGSW